MAVQVQSFNQGDWLKWEHVDHRFSRDEVVLAPGQSNILTGTVLGQLNNSVTDQAVVTPAAANAGKGVLTMDATTPILTGAQPGAYVVKCTTAAAGAGTFTVYDPHGNSLGTITVGGTAFATQIKFTIADGTPDFAVNDQFSIVVGPEIPATVKALNLSASDGTQNAAGVLLYSTDATSGAVKTTMIAREAVVSSFGLTWPAGITQAQQDAAVAQLAAKGIQVRQSA
jgi:hypothetical protein